MTWGWTETTTADLRRFLEERGLTSGPLRLTPIGDGHSNLTYLVTDGERSMVLRRPPPPPTPPGAHDMLREARLVRALSGSRVPVATVLATAEVGEVLDVAFYVMSLVLGEVVTDSTPAVLAGSRRTISEGLVDTLVALHDVDPKAAGLEGFGRPEGFNRRHLDRMARLVADEDGAPPAAFAAIEGWLRDHVPGESAATVVHNDFRLGNVIVTPSTGAIAAVLDWELATLGDPLIDVAYLLSSVPVPGEQLTPTQELARAMLEDGYASRAELADRYAERSGRDLSTLPWYTALVNWKLAVLYEYGRRRAVQGIGDPYYAEPGQVEAFLDAAHRSAGVPL